MGKEEGTHTGPNQGAMPENDTKKVDQTERRNPTTGGEGDDSKEERRASARIDASQPRVLAFVCGLPSLGERASMPSATQVVGGDEHGVLPSLRWVTSYPVPAIATTISRSSRTRTVRSTVSLMGIRLLVATQQ